MCMQHLATIFFHFVALNCGQAISYLPKPESLSLLMAMKKVLNNNKDNMQNVEDMANMEFYDAKCKMRISFNNYGDALVSAYFR